MSNQPRDDLSWPADYADGENKYHCCCVHCERDFYGNRRILCSSCAATNDALKSARAEIANLKHDIERHITITSEQATEIVGKDKRIGRLEADLNECLEFLDGQEDVVDGSYGEPAPNRAMSLANTIRETLGIGGY